MELLEIHLAELLKPLINIPVLNIGNRQAGRIRLGKVYDVPSDFIKVKRGLDIIFGDSEKFKKKDKKIVNLKSPSLEIIKWINYQRHIGFRA